MPALAAVEDDAAAFDVDRDCLQNVGAGGSGLVKGRLLRAGLAGCCTIAALAVASCSGSAPPVSAPTATGATTTRTSAPAIGASPTSTAAEQRAVEAAYREFWPVVATFAESPESRWRTVLGRVAVDPQLSFAIAVTRTQRGNGITVYGLAVPRELKTTISSGGRALVRDCADFSRAGQADARTKQPRTVGVVRTPLSVTLLKGADGRWRVSQVKFLGGRC